MGFFQSLFNKEKGAHHARKEAVMSKSTPIRKTAPTPAEHNCQSLVAESTAEPAKDSSKFTHSRRSSLRSVLDSIMPNNHHDASKEDLSNIPNSSSNVSPNQSMNFVSAAANNNNTNTPSKSAATMKVSPTSSLNRSGSSKKKPGLSSRKGSIDHQHSCHSQQQRRFQLLEDGTHRHHLMLPAPNRLAASINGLVSGLAKQSLRFTQQWAERKISIDEIKKERATLNAKLKRTENRTLQEKWGSCQETIGKGASGVVRVLHRIDENKVEHLYAVKELRKKTSESSKGYINRLIAEFYISSSMQHINIIKTFDLLPMHETSPIYGQVMEYSGGGDLFDVLYDSPDGLDVNEANCFFKQLMCGVCYLHEMGVAHRDLKPENLLLTTTGCLKISDFGSAACFKGTKMQCDEDEDNDEKQKQKKKSKKLLQNRSRSSSKERTEKEEDNDDDDDEESDDDDNDCNKIHLVRGLVGSEPYIAPEEFTKKSYDARLVDVWSCGIIYMAMRKSTHLWQVAKSGEDEAYDKYLKFRQLLDEERENARREHSMRRKLEKTLSEQDRLAERAKREADVVKARETIRRKARDAGCYHFEGIDIHAKKVMYRILDPNPEKRITASEVLQSDWCRNIYSCVQADSHC